MVATLVDGILLIILILPPIFKKVSLVMSLNLLLKRWNKTTRRLAQKYLFQRVCIDLFTLLAAFFTKISPLVGMSVGVFVAVIILRIYSKNQIHQVSS